MIIDRLRRATKGAGSILSILLLQLVAFVAQAQYVTFSQAAALATQEGPYSTLTPTAIAVDPAGNTYLTGSFYDVVTLGTTTLQPHKGRIFVAKRDPAGRYLWVVQAGGGQWEEGHDIAVDAAGNVYVAGYFDNAPANFGSIQVRNQTGHNGFIAKLSPTGTWLWAVRGGGYATAEPAALALDRQANVYVTGYFEYGPAYFGPFTLPNASTGNADRDTFVAKLTSEGQWQWAVGIGGSGNELGRDIAVDAAGKVHVIGDFTSPTLTLGKDRLTSFGASDMFVAQLDAQGAPEWMSGGGGDNWDRGVTLAVDRQGNTYVGGTFFSAQVRFGTIDLYKTGLSEVFVGKVNSSGAWSWAKRIGGTGPDHVDGIAVDAQGDAYVTGSHASPYFTAGFLGTPQRGGLDNYVFKLSSTTGDCLWLTSGGGMLQDTGEAIAVDRNGTLHVAGTFEQEATFGAVHLTAPLPHRLGYVAQIPSTSVPLANTSGKAEEGFTVYPNPTTGLIEVAGGRKGEQLFLYTTHGDLVWQHTCQSVVEKIRLPASLSKGLYMIHYRRRYHKILVE